MANLSEIIANLFNQSGVTPVNNVSGVTPASQLAAAASDQQQVPAQGFRPNEAANPYQAMQDDYSSMFGQPINAPQGEWREMTPLERGLAQTQEWSHELTSLTGWDPNAGFTPGNIVKFGTGLPFQMAGGMLEGVGSAYEAATGKPIRDNPWTQFENEVDLENNRILDYDLSAPERISAGANAFIDFGGLAVGGSARGIGAVGELASAGRLGSRMATGMFGRAMQSPAARVGGQIGFDVGEEAGEEFSQSYLDDIRWNHVDEGSLDRAILGAKWGALGGGMMSAGGHAIHQGVNAYKGRNSGQSGQMGEQSQVNQIEDPSVPYRELKQRHGSLVGMDQTRAYQNEKLGGAGRFVDGSAVVKHGAADNDIFFNHIDLGEEAIARSYDSTPGSRKAIQDLFKSNEAEMDAAIHANSNGKFVHNNIEYDTRKEALSAIKDANIRPGEHMRVGIGRNPDTKNGGFYVNVRNIVDGGDIVAHPMVYAITGSDIDGDTSTVYFDTSKTNFIGYASDMFAHPEGASNVDWYFSGIGYGTTRNNIDRTFQQILGKYTRKAEDGKRMANSYADRFDEAINIKKDSDRNATLSKLFMEMQNDIQSMNDAHEYDANMNHPPIDPHRAMDFIIHDLSRPMEAMMEDAVANTNEIFINAIEQETNTQEQKDAIEEMCAVARGSVGSHGSAPVQLYSYIGLLNYALTGKGNLTYRQYGELYYASKDVKAFQDMVSEASKFVDDGDIFSTLIRASFRMVQAGVAPTTAIEGMIDSFTLTKTLGEFGSNSRLQTMNDVNKLFDAFLKNYNDYVRVYNNAERALTKRGFEPIRDKVHREELSDTGDPRFIRAFNKVFSNVPVEVLFDMDQIGHQHDGKTLSQYLRPLAENPGRARIELVAFGDKGVQSVLNRLVANFNTEKTAVRSRIEQIVGDVKLNSLKARIDENGNLDANDQASFAAFVDGLAMILDPDIAIEGGLLGTAILGTRVGNSLISNNLNERLNALIGFSLHTQYARLIDDFNSDDAETHQRAVEAIHNKGMVSELHAVISNQILNHGGYSELLNLLIDLDVSYESKMDMLAKRKDMGEAFHPSTDLLVDSLRTENSDFDLSSMSARIRKAETAFTKSVKAMYEEDRAEVARIKQKISINGVPENQFVQFFKDACNRAYAQFNLDILGQQAYSAATVANSAVEKGVIQAAASHAAVSMDYIINGAPRSVLHQITGEKFDSCTVDEFMQNRQFVLRALSDPKFEMHVFDPITGEDTIVTQESIIKSAFPEYNGRGLNNQAIMAILEKYPQLVGYLAHSQPQPGMVDGLPNVSLAKTKSFEESFVDWCASRQSSNATTDTRVDWDRENAKGNISNILLNKTWYRGYLIRCIDDIDHKLTPGQLTTEMTRLHHQAVNAAFNASLYTSKSRKLNIMRRDYLMSICESNVQDIMDTVSVANSHIAELMTQSTFSENVFRTIGETLRNQSFLSDVMRKMRKEGISNEPDMKDAFVDLSDLVESSQQQAEEIVNDLRVIVSLIAKMYSRDELDYGYRPTSSYVEQVRSAVRDAVLEHRNSNRQENEKLTNLNEEDENLVNSIVDSSASDIVDAFDAAVSDDHLLLREDVTKDSIVNKVMSIHGEIGSNMTLEQATEEVNGLFDDDGVLDVKEAEKYFLSQNNLYFSHRLNMISRKSGVDINANMFKASNDTMNDISDLINDIRSEVDFKWDSPEVYATNRNGRLDFPIPTFSNPTAEAMVNQMRNMDNAGHVPTAVSLNGGMTKQQLGFGFLPRDMMGEVPPTQTTFAELASRPDFKDIQNWKCTLVPNGEGVNATDLHTVGGLIGNAAQRATVDMNTPVWVYDPDMNIHGVSASNSTASVAPAAEGYLRMPGILGIILDHSQEGMVLKAKKVLLGKNSIVNKRNGRTSKFDVSQEALGNPASAFTEMRKVFMSARRGFAEELRLVFESDDFKGTPLGADQARILSQALTVGMRVTTSDNNVHIIDARHFFLDPSSFEARWNEVTQNGQLSVTTASVRFATPTEISYRIMRRVSERFHELENPTESDTQRAAWDAMCNWDDFTSGDLSIENIFARASNVGYAYSGGMVAPDSPTPVQFLLDHEFDGGFGAMSNHVRSQVDGYNGYNINDGRYQDAMRVTKKLGLTVHGEAGAVTIVQAFTKDRKGAIGGFKRKYDVLDPIKPRDTRRVIDGAAICLDESKINDAMRWGEETNQMVLFPSSFLKRMSVPFNAMNAGTFHSSLFDMDFMAVDPSASARTRRYMNGMPRSKYTALEPYEITGALVDMENKYIPGDAQIIGSRNMLGLQTSDARAVDMKPSKLLGDYGRPYSLADRDSLMVLRDQVNNGNFSHVDFRSLEDNNVLDDVAIRDLRTFLDGISNKAAGTDGVLRTNVGHGSVVAMVTDGVNFAPIYLPNSATRSVDSIRVEVFGDNVTVGWSGRFSMDEPGARVKMGVDGEAFKGEMTVDDRVQFPTILDGRGDVDMIISADTQSGRAYGKDLVFHVRDAWYLFKKFGEQEGWSLLFDKDGDGNAVFKQSIANAFGNDESVLEDVRKGVFFGAWDKVISGQVQLVTKYAKSEDNANANRIISDVVLACKMYHINPVYMFSPFARSDSGKAMPINRDLNFFMALGKLSHGEIATLFNAIDDRICPPQGQAVSNEAMDAFGNTRVVIGGQAYYMPVRWGNHKVIGDQSGMHVPGNRSKYAFQHVYRRGLDLGYLDNELSDIIEYADFMLDNVEYVQKRETAKTLEQKHRAAAVGVKPEMRSDSLIGIIEQYPNDTWHEIKHRKAVLDRGRHLSYVRPVIDGGEVVENPMANHKIAAAMENLREALGGTRFSYEFVNIEAGRQTGYTWLDGGKNEVSVDKLAAAINDMARNVRNHGIPIRNTIQNGRPLDDRFALPRLIPEEVDAWWASPNIQAKWGSREAFIDAIKEESQRALEQVQQIESSKNSQKIALNTAFEYDWNQWGETAPNGYLYGGAYTADLVEATDRLGEALRQGMGDNGIGFDADEFDNLTERDRKILADVRNALESSNKVKEFSIENTNGGVSIIVKTDDGKLMTAMLDNATELTKVMALINPGVLVSNLLDRGVHQTMMNAMLHLGHKLHLGPYVGEHWLNQDIVTKAVNDPLFMDLYVGYRQAGFSGNEMEFLANANSAEQIKTWIAERKKGMTPFQKFCDRIYDTAAGGNILLKTQMKNFLNRFVMFAEQDPSLSYLFEDVGGVSYLETRLNENPGKLFVDLIGGNNGKAPGTLTAALQAMNSAKSGDMAQRHTIGMMFGEVCRRSPLSKFLVISTISRFPNYTLCVSQRMMNWIMPSSSIYYVFTERVAEAARNRSEKSGGKIADPHYEMAQIHTSLREAMLVDITHLGMTAVAVTLLGMSGGIEPPDDEKKWGNPQEWIICGLRVGEAWWMEDILGLVLPLVTFVRSAQLGNPRIDLLFNGMSQVCYNNPMIKVADAVGWLFEPEGSFFTDYNEDYERYQNALGGPPSVTDWMQASTTSFGLSWVSQFFTPSVVREWYRNSQQWEASYKRIYEEDVTGKLTEGGALGETMPTTYADAMLRRTTRKNPMLGWLCDQIIHPETGYMWHEMPYVTYRDDVQLAEQERWSIQGLSDQEAQAKCLEIIYYMQQYDDMGELAATGFHLDYETKAAISSIVWDTVQELDDWYYGLQADGKLDAYYLGNGDFSEGMKLKGQIVKEYKDQKTAWSNFYYDKVRSSELSEPLAEYRRYNTTYARDENGDFYATGFRPQGVLPFISAPGRIDNPEGTAGYGNDWAAVSAVTGEPMGQRALVSWVQDYEEWPDLEAWSGDGNGNGHSNLYKQWYGSSGASSAAGSSDQNAYYNNTSPLTPTSSANEPASTDTPSDGLLIDPISSLNRLLEDLPEDADTNGSSGKPRRGTTGYTRGGRGGGGGGGRGGGSSKGYSNSRYSPTNASTPRTQNHTNFDRAYLDYLRPNWETKGSREAYKRGDI